MGTANSINNSGCVWVPFVDQESPETRASGLQGRVCLPKPGLGAPAQRPALSHGVFRPGGTRLRYKDGTELAQQDGLEECTDFCIFYINKTLIPIFCPFRTTWGPMCIPPMWTLHPPLAFLFDGEDWGETIPPQACAGHPFLAPAHKLGRSSHGLRPGVLAAAPAETQQCPESRPPGRCQTAGQ